MNAKVIFVLRNGPGDFKRDWDLWDLAPLEEQKARLLTAIPQWLDMGYWLDHATFYCDDGTRIDCNNWREALAFTTREPHGLCISSEPERAE